MSAYKTKLLDPKFRIEFIKQLEERMIEKATRGKDQNYIDTVLELCEKHEIEPELISSLITGPVKIHIREEAEKRNLIRKEKKWKPLI